MGEMARMRELAEAREALFTFLAEWETPGYRIVRDEAAQ